MATFREAREALLLANDLDLIDDEEMLLLYDLNRSKNLDIPYWKYGKFELDSLSDDECKSEFRFLKHDIYTLLDVLNLPHKITCQNRFLCTVRKLYVCFYVDLPIRVGTKTSFHGLEDLSRSEVWWCPKRWIYFMPALETCFRV